MQRLTWCAVVAAIASTACSATPPPRWAEGGAPLVIAPARWDRGDSGVIEVQASGQITEDGKPLMLIDRAGRVVDEDNDPVAILLPDGHVVGTDDQALGFIGLANAAPPGSATAWLAVMPDGKVTYFDDDGERAYGGSWTGCEGPQKRTCTLVTHLIAIRDYQRRARSGVGIGFGIGVGF
ncbi:MAG TPA: hypothetical protein VKZ49_19660 [Polyangiaceae bacterium]|nr:hypothetical protein [Polyangiaceae bacterium]